MIFSSPLPLLFSEVTTGVPTMLKTVEKAIGKGTYTSVRLLTYLYPPCSISDAYHKSRLLNVITHIHISNINSGFCQLAIDTSGSTCSQNLCREGDWESISTSRVVIDTLYKCILPTPYNPRFYRILQKSHLPFARTFPNFLGNTSVSQFTPLPPHI